MADRGRNRARKGKSDRIDPEYEAQNLNRQGPSPGDPIDEEVIHSPKSDWVEKSSPAAGDQVTQDELNAFDLLGRSGVRDDALEGPSDAHGPSSGRTPGAKRRNPPLPEISDEIDMSGRGDGGGGASGGASGGARGNSGS